MHGPERYGHHTKEIAKYKPYYFHFILFFACIQLLLWNNKIKFHAKEKTKEERGRGERGEGNEAAPFHDGMPAGMWAGR